MLIKLVSLRIILCQGFLNENALNNHTLRGKSQQFYKYRQITRN